MQKTLVIVGHPDINNESVANKIILDRLKQENNIEIRNLARLYPTFNIDVDQEQEALIDIDIVVFQYPFYWYSVPGILKEWMDRVFEYGFAYGSTGNKLHGKQLLISTTVGGAEKAYNSEGYNSFTMDEFFAPMKQTAKLCGMSFLDPIVSHGMFRIPGNKDVSEEVVEKAKLHAQRLIEAIRL